MAKFSVKKPLTVFVAVVIALVLGIVSYTRMTPDLLPNIDLPYVLVTTPYPGASPETVEREVSKPLEQAMATLDDIETVSSTSNENYSMVILQFADGANLDTITVDILQKINTVSGSWGDMVSTPTILKINPNMLPVGIAAVDMESLGTAELSEFVNETLLNKLEAITGVASVSAEGLLEEQITIELSQQKLDEVNARIREALDKQIDEKRDELQETRDELQESRDEMQGNLDELNDGKSKLDDGKDALGKVADVGAGLTQTQAELANYKSMMQIEIAALELAQKESGPLIAQLYELRDGFNEIEGAWNGLQAALLALADTLGVAETGSQLAGDFEALEQLLWDTLNFSLSLAEEALAQDPTDAFWLAAYQELLETKQTLETIQAQRAAVDASYAQLLAALRVLGVDSFEEMPDVIAELEKLQTSINTELNSARAQLAQVEAGSVAVSEGLAELERGKTKGILEMSEGLSKLFVGETLMTQGLEQMDSGLEQIDEGLEQIEEAREDAYKAADARDTITMAMVSQVLSAQNFSMPAGYVEDDGESVLVSVGDTINSFAELSDLVLFDLRIDGMDPVMLLDVADLGTVDNEEDIYANINGNAGVLLSFSKQSNYATAKVSDNIKDAFAELEAQYPGLKFTNLMDQGDYIYMVVWAVIQNLLSGAVLAVVVLFVFLKNIKPTLVTLVSIPISVLFAFILMYFSGVSLNMFSLSGLAVAVGMLVDNSVVVIENIYRLRAKGVSAIQAAVSGAHQVGGAIAASTLTTIAIFMPIVFIEGITRQLFTDFALTFAYALLASLVVALTVVPSMSSRLLQGEMKEQKQPVMDRVLGVYKKSLKWVLNHKLPVLAVVLVLLMGSSALVLMQGFTFMPEMNMGQLTVTLEMPEGSTRQETAEMSDLAVDRYIAVDGVETVGAMISGGLMSGGGDDTVTMYVLLDDTRSISAITEDLQALSTDLDAVVSISSSSGMDISALGGSGITVYLYGDDMDAMHSAARAAAAHLAEVEGTANVDDGIDDTSAEIRFTVNKNKAMEEGLTVAQVFAAVREALTVETSSTTITTEDGDSYEILVRDGSAEELTPAYIKGLELTVTDREGEERLVPIGAIAEIQDTETSNSIRRTEGRRYMTISAEIAEGYNVTLVTSAAEAHFADFELTGGMTIEFAGENETIMDALSDLVLMLLLGILLVYLIMVAQFQSLKSPFIVMFTIPLAFTGGMLALLVTGNEMSVISLIGFVMLVGIIVNNGIVLVDYINQLRAEGRATRKAIVEAGVTRIRPILMTSITTIFGLFTMAIGMGTGTDIMQPIAVVCIGGLLYATLLTLYVVPAIYEILNRKELTLLDDSELEIVED